MAMRATSDPAPGAAPVSDSAIEAKMAGTRHANVLFVCADRGTPYLDTVFDPAWAAKLE